MLPADMSLSALRPWHCVGSTYAPLCRLTRFTHLSHWQRHGVGRHMCLARRRCGGRGLCSTQASQDIGAAPTLRWRAPLSPLTNRQRITQCPPGGCAFVGAKAVLCHALRRRRTSVPEAPCPWPCPCGRGGGGGIEAGAGGGVIKATLRPVLCSQSIPLPRRSELCRGLSCTRARPCASPEAPHRPRPIARVQRRPPSPTGPHARVPPTVIPRLCSG